MSLLRSYKMIVDMQILIAINYSKMRIYKRHQTQYKEDKRKNIANAGISKNTKST